MDDMWASLPTDLLLVIFLSLEPTAIIRCAGVCKPWRRAIVGTASILGPHLDRYGPSLLLGVFRHGRDGACLRRTPGPFQSALPLIGRGDDEAVAAHSLIPASSAISSGVDRGLYKELLCSSDGFILLMAGSGHERNLCLCNPMTRDCSFLPSAARGRYSSYLLLTNYHTIISPSGTGSDLVPRILAVHRRKRYNDNVESVFKFKARVLSYQIFSKSGDDNAGKWGPVMRSVGELEEGLSVCMQRWTTVLCGDGVHWLAGPGGNITCALGLDLRSGRTWTTELPKQCHFGIDSPVLAILAATSDGRLSLMQSFDLEPRILVWVLIGDAGWTLQQMIPIVGNWCLNTAGGHIPQLIWFSAFCPRSRCMVAISESGHEFLIDLGSGSSSAPVMHIGKNDGLDCCPYEIDCASTYISRLKHF